MDLPPSLITPTPWVHLNSGFSLKRSVGPFCRSHRGPGSGDLGTQVSQFQTVPKLRNVRRISAGFPLLVSETGMTFETCGRRPYNTHPNTHPIH